MTKTRYIRRILRAMCGTAPASPHLYHMISDMADRVDVVYRFDNET